MAAAKLTYGQPFRVSIGARFLTLTKVTVEATNEEYAAKGIPLSYASLGLPDGKPDVVLALSGLTDKESEKQYDTLVAAEKLIVYQAGKEKEFNPELEATKKLAGYYSEVLAIGI